MVACPQWGTRQCKCRTEERHQPVTCHTHHASKPFPHLPHPTKQRARRVQEETPHVQWLAKCFFLMYDLWNPMEVCSCPHCLIVNNEKVASISEARLQVPTCKKSRFRCEFSKISLGTIIRGDMPPCLPNLALLRMCVFLMVDNRSR